MKTNQLDYELPSELIAQDPAEVRSASRLLVVDRASGSLTDSRFDRIGDYLRSGDCLVLNDTKVLPARFFARRRTGGGLEALFLSETATPGVWRIMLKGARKLKPDEPIHIIDGREQDYCTARVVERQDGGVCLLELDVKAAGGDRAQRDRLPAAAAVYPPGPRLVEGRERPPAVPDGLRPPERGGGGADGGAALHRGIAGTA